MKDLAYRKLPGGQLIAADQGTEEYTARLKDGDVLVGDFVKPRNYEFHKKYFTMLDFAYDHWEPGEISSKYGTPQKNKKRFRKDIAILAGFYEINIRLDGSTRIEAKSISFANMEQEDFEDLYSKTIDIVLAKILKNYTGEELQEAVDQLLLGYDS